MNKQTNIDILRQYPTADIARVSLRLVYYLQRTEHRTPTAISEAMLAYGEGDPQLWSAAAIALAGSSIIDKPRITRDEEGRWIENGIPMPTIMTQEK